MIFSVITQSGTKIGTLNNTIYQYSDNLTFQFLRDAKFNEYTLGAYINYDDKIYGLEVSEDDTFKVDSRFLNEKKEFLLSFSLTNGEEIIHLGTINYRVKDAFGSTTSPLPGQKEVWTVLVEQEVDDYFLKNYQSQLDDFNQKYEEIKKIASSGSGGGSNVTVDSELNSTSKNPVQNQAIYKEFSNLNKKVENIPTNFKKINNTEITGDGNIDIPIVNVDAELNETSTNAIQNQAVAKGLNKKANLTDLGINKYQKSETDATVVLENGSWTVFPTMTSLNVYMGDVDENKAFICGFQFTSGDTATSLTLNNCTLTSNSDSVETNKTYEVNILDGSAIVREI